MPYAAKRSLNAQGAFVVSGGNFPHNRHRRLRGAFPFDRELVIIQGKSSFASPASTAGYAPSHVSSAVH